MRVRFQITVQYESKLLHMSQHPQWYNVYRPGVQNRLPFHSRLPESGSRSGAKNDHGGFSHVETCGDVEVSG
jgi:hypothetical protein